MITYRTNELMASLINLKYGRLVTQVIQLKVNNKN